MDIKDFEIEIKKIDKVKQIVIVNLVVKETIVIRSFMVRRSNYPLTNDLFWWVAPPALQNKMGKYFWLVQFLDKNLWKQVECKIAEKIEETKPFSEDKLQDEEINQIAKKIN